MRVSKKNEAIKSGLLCGLIFLIIILPALVIGRGRLYMSADFNSQQIPFNIMCNKEIKNGEYFWSWHTDLGSNFIASYSFYNIGSIFFWILMLVPSNFVVYALGPVLVLKFFVSGCSSFLYLGQYVKDKKYAYIGAILYTFSGYVFSNLFYNHFMDVISFFPLFLFALDQTINNNKKWFFAIMVAIMALTNYVFFVMEVVFIILYFISKVCFGEYKITVKKFWNLAIESITGFCVGSIIIVPSVLDLLGNPRSTVHFSNVKDMLIYAFDQYILIVKAAFLPADLQNGASIFENRWTCTELYLPMIGMIFCISYIIHCQKKRNFIFTMLLVCIVMSFIPVLNSSFQLFNKAYYTRWFFMFTLMLSLASIKAMEEQYEITISSIFCAVVIIELTIYLKTENVINNKFFWWIFILSILGLIYTLWCFKKITVFKMNNFFLFLLGFVLLEGSGHFYNTFEYRNIDNYFDNFVGIQNLSSLPEDEFYRTENKVWNTSMVSENKDIICWNSTVSASIFSFYNNVGAGRHITSSPQDELYGLRVLLSVKYIYNNKNNFLDMREYLNDNVNVIYENLNYLPMGFGFDYYITEEEYQSIPVEQRHLVLLKALVMSEEDIEKYQGCLKKLDSAELNNLNQESFKQDVAERRKNVCSYFQEGKNSFQAKIDLNEDKMIFFSVPYEKGWTASINGEKAEVVKVDDGLIALKCNAGSNEIQFRYVPQGFKLGMCLSVLSGIIIIVGLFWEKRKLNEKKKKDYMEVDANGFR